MPTSDLPATWDERATLLAILDHARSTAVDIATALGAAAGTAPVATSPLTTAGGVVNHLRWVEQWWIGHITFGQPSDAPWTDDDPDAEFRLGAELPLAEVIAGYQAQTRQLDSLVAGADLDTRTLIGIRGDDHHPTLRWVLLHLIDETARHNGQLDIISELITGRPGS